MLAVLVRFRLEVHSAHRRECLLKRILAFEAERMLLAG